MTLLDFNWIFSKVRKANPEKNWNGIHFFSGLGRPQRLGPNPEKIHLRAEEHACPTQREPPTLLHP
jgi:hypothetical protein